MVGISQDLTDSSSPDAAVITDEEVGRKLLGDGLERRVAGQLSLVIPIGLIGWVAADISGARTLWLLLGLQIIAQIAIAATSQWLRRTIVADAVPLLPKILWMAAEASAGAIWATAMLLLGPLINGSEAALTAWITILLTMAVSMLLSAPIAGICFPLLGGFAAALTVGILFFNPAISSFSELALIMMTGVLYVIAKAVNANARVNCRAGMAVVRLSERLEEELRRTSWLSRHDSLTGLLNRSALLSEFKQMGNISVSLILLDIDHFKRINDSHGHSQGDAVIAAIGGCVRETLAGTAPGALAARWGGEEFIIALPGSTGEAVAADIAEKLRIAVAGLTGQDWPARLKLTGSFGVASGPASAFAAIFKNADGAMYQAKERGRNRVVCANDRGGQAAEIVRAA